MNIIQNFFNRKALAEIRAKWGKKVHRKRKYEFMKELFNSVREDF
jgi:hypothetical protein